EPGQDLYIGELNPGQTTVNAFHSDIGDVATEPGINYSTVNVINADPLFVNPLVDNYHLDNGSPCIDTGTTVVPIPPGLPTTDLDGNPRIWGAEPDIGVYEWIGNAIVWDCPLSLVALISPYPANDRPFLATAVDLSQVIYESTWFQVYYLDEATGTVFWYDSILESGTLVWLQPWDYYYVVVSNPCDLYIPQ
ncbi:MAG: choice-of-anchor Q domain-containing protein, partial [Chloroflexota bacterium]|nr:choice-of-anchor Q domain-containing protein [Chloroflexota bacterium]